MALLEAQLSQLRTEKHFLLNSVVNSQKKDEIIRILVDQLKFNAPRQYLIETASCIRKMDEGLNANHDKDIDRVCRLLEAPIDLVLFCFSINSNTFFHFLFFFIFCFKQKYFLTFALQKALV